MGTQVIPVETSGGGGGGGGATITYDTYANVPASPSAGDMHVCSDSMLIRVYDGSAWQDRLPGAGNVTVPPSTGWTVQGGTTLSTVGGYQKLDGPGNTANPGGSIYRTAPATPYTITVGIQGALGESFRFGFYDSGTDDAAVLLKDGRVVEYRSWSTTWTTSLTILEGTTLNEGRPQNGAAWYQIEDDGTNLYWRVGHGPDPTNGGWDQVYTEGRTTRFTSGPPEITIGTWSAGTAFIHYEVT